MSSHDLLHKPISGGVFGRGRYALASMPCVALGLHSARYMVVEPRAGAVLSVAEDKVEALAAARRVLLAAATIKGNADTDESPTQGELFPKVADQDDPEAGLPMQRAIPRRRREVFHRTGGRCFYCSAPLQLDGEWHVEHQLPRALGGGDDALNLVAACVPCNLAKSDSTAIEFVTRSSRAD